VIPPELIEQIRDAADPVQLIGEHVELKRTGADWRGPCPFHGGTNRNFSVVPRKQMYHCFVCHESGDVFTFWMKRFGLDYPAAVREIAGKVGIVVPETARQGPDPNEPLYSTLAVAAEWFARRLRESDDAAHARGYLESRELAPGLWDDYQLGYAPLDRSALLGALAGLGLEEEALLAAGIAVRREDGSLVPRFRGRLLFPIRDVRGRVVGFGGRILGEGEPKYLNSAENAVFHKGTLLYGLDRARHAIRSEGFAVVVEGYVDCIRLQSAGIGCAVAPLGTALTGEQARVLSRYTKEVVLAYDADTPGLRSTFRAGDELLRQGLVVKVVTLPAGEDPDTLVRKGGAAAFRALLGDALDILDRKIQLLERKRLFDDLPGRRRALDRLLPSIRAAADPVQRELYLERVHQILGIDRAILEREVQRDAARPVPRRDAGEAAAPAPGTGIRAPEDYAERMVARLMLQNDAWVARARTELRAELLTHPVYRLIIEARLAGALAPPAEQLALEWERLAQPLDEGPFDPESEWNGAIARVNERAGAEELDRLRRAIPVAPAEERERLFEKLAASPRGRRFRKDVLKPPSAT
jgi:DNA primase